jgi:protein-tyrosine phosphatase
MMNMIADRIFVGDQPDTDGLAQANPNGITAVLSCRSEAPDAAELARNNAQLNVPLPVGVTSYRVPLVDGATIPQERFWEALGWLDERYRRGARILIHCAAGVSRSVTICAAFMVTHNLASDMEQALAIIKVHRPQAGPNPLVWTSAKEWLG